MFDEICNKLYITFIQNFYCFYWCSDVFISYVIMFLISLNTIKSVGSIPLLDLRFGERDPIEPMYERWRQLTRTAPKTGLGLLSSTLHRQRACRDADKFSFNTEFIAICRCSSQRMSLFFFSVCAMGSNEPGGRERVQRSSACTISDKSRFANDNSKEARGLYCYQTR